MQIRTVMHPITRDNGLATYEIIEKPLVIA